MIAHLTENEIEALAELAKANPERMRLVHGVEGLVTCDGYAVELYDKDGRWTGVIHPKAYIDMILELEKSID